MQIIEKSYPWNGQLSARGRTDLLILHHAAAKNCSADDVHRWHLQNGWVGIGYNFFVRKDGSVYRGRPENAVGAHTEGYNSISIGVCFEGNFDVEQMGEVQKKAGQELLGYLKGKYPGAKVMRHLNYDATACPGKYFPFAEIAGGNAGGSVPAPAESSKNEAEEVCEVTVPVLGRGDESGYVRTMQILLNKYNAAGLVEDGDFGPATDSAVRAYQKDRGLDVDGLVGAKTWAQLVK